jgi:RNA polymerase sigma-70 factor (ECF subfamily)
VLERDLMSRADPERGRFRTFLKSAVRNFLVDQHRRATSKARAPGTALLGGGSLEDFEPSEEDDPSRAFERQWAATVLSRTLERLEADCAGCGQQKHWAAFRMAVIDPAIGLVPGDGTGRGVPALDDVARRVGAPGPDQVSSMIQTIRRKFRRMLTEVVGQTLENPGDAADEVARIQDSLSL